MESLNVKNINDEKIFNVIDPNGQGEVVNRIRPISISINQKAQTINDQTDSTINLAVYWNDTWKSILDLTFDESLRQEYGKLTEDLTKIQKDIDMKQYKDAETKTADFLKYVANLSSKYTAIPETTNVAKVENDFISIKAEKNSVKATISDNLLNFMLRKFAKVDNLDYTKANECFSTNKFNVLANHYDIYYHSPEIFQKQAYMTVVKDNKVVGSYKVNYDQFSKFATKFMLTPQKLGYSKDRLAGYMKTAEVVMQNIFFDSVDEAKEWQEMVDEKKKETAQSPEGEEETTEIKETKTKTEIGEGKSESPVKEDGGLTRPSEDFASDEIPESEPKQQEQQQGGGQDLRSSRRVNLLKKKAGVRQTQKINNTINDIKQYYNELNQKSKEELIKKVLESNKDFSKEFGNKGKNVLENKDEEYLKQILLRNKYKYDEGYDFAFENFGSDEQNINDKMLDLLNKGMITEEFYKGVQQGLRDGSLNDVLLRKERNEKRRQKYHETKEKWKDIGKMYGESSKEKNLTKKATVGYNAEPENMEEEVAIDLADELMSAANVALEKAGLLLGGYSGEEQRRQRVDVQKNAIEPLLKGRLKESIQGKVIDLIKEHLTDLNYHTLVSAIEEIMDGKQANKKVELNKKAEEKLYKYEELSEDAKDNVRSAFSEDDHSWWYEDLFPEEQEYLLKEKYAQYNVELDNLDIEWDNYNRCTVNLKDKFAYWDAFRTIWVDCAKQVLKDLPMFANNAELLEDWATEAASDMYFQHDHFETYSGLNDIDGQDGMELSYKISDLCTKAYEDKVEPILSDIAGDFENILEKQEEYFYSEDYIKEECAVREILFDENGNMVKEGKKRKSLNKNAKNKILANKRKAKKLNKKALYGDVQEQDTVPAKTETKVYLQSEKVEDFVWLINSSGRIEILAPKALVMGATGSGDNSEGVEELRDYIKKDLEKISVEEMQKTVSEYGIDNVKEMDKDELERYLVWLLAGDTADNIENRLADKEDLENIKANTNSNVQKKAEEELSRLQEDADKYIKKDVESTEEYLKKYLEKSPELFKAQYGVETVEEALKLLKEKNPNWYKKAEEQMVEEKIEEQVADDTVKGKIGVGDIVAINFDNVISSEDFPKYEEFIGKPLILMENDKEDITKVIVEQTEYPFQRITVDNKDVVMYEGVKGEDVIVEDVDGDEMITTFEELPIVAKQCKIKSIHKAANINKKKANLTKKAINSLEDVAGLIDTIWSDYDWYEYADALEVGEKSHYENILADLQKDEKGTIEALFNRLKEDEEYSSPKIEQLKEYYNNKFSNGGK